MKSLKLLLLLAVLSSALQADQSNVPDFPAVGRVYEIVYISSQGSDSRRQRIKVIKINGSGWIYGEVRTLSLGRKESERGVSVLGEEVEYIWVNPNAVQSAKEVGHRA